jgi:uncharacterized protein involved in outer membrane biogenesis
VVDLNWRPPKISVGGRALSMPLNALAKDIGYQSDITGKLSVLTGITTAGTGTRALLRNLRGKLALALHDGKIAGAAYDVLATDFLAWIYSGASRQKSTVIDCVMASFDLHDGIAESDNLYIETERMVAKGSAKFNFKREKLDISITPRSKSRKLQVPSAVRIAGDFDDPKPDVSPIAAAADIYTEFITLVPRIAKNIFHIDPKHGKHASPCAVQ